MKSIRIKYILAIVAIILLIPLVAMQFTEEVNWTTSDFVFGGIILLVFGVLIDIVLQLLSKSKYKVVIIIAIVILLALIWMELAVGLFETPFAGN